MYRMTKLFVLSLILTAGSVVAAEPQTTTKPTTAEPKQGQMDHSKMGHGTMDHSKMPADHHAVPSDEFTALDKNKDGKLTKAEFPAKHPLAAHFGMLDTNRDGSLSKAEFAKHHDM